MTEIGSSSLFHLLHSTCKTHLFFLNIFVGTTVFLGPLQIASHHNGYSVHTRCSLPKAGAPGGLVQSPALWPARNWIPASWAAEGGGFWWWVPGLERGRKQGGLGQAEDQEGLKCPRCRDGSLSSCVTTSIWLVSQISPAGDISFTTV